MPPPGFPHPTKAAQQQQSKDDPRHLTFFCYELTSPNPCATLFLVCRWTLHAAPLLTAPPDPMLNAIFNAIRMNIPFLAMDIMDTALFCTLHLFSPRLPYPLTHMQCATLCLPMPFLLWRLTLHAAPLLTMDFHATRCPFSAPLGCSSLPGVGQTRQTRGGGKAARRRGEF